LSKRRVVVTGLGIVSPVGNDVATAWASIISGRSGIGPVTRIDTTTFSTHFGGEIRDLDLDPYLTPKEARRMDAFMQYGVVAGTQAMRDSGFVVTEANNDRIGILMGSSRSRPPTTNSKRRTRRARYRRFSYRAASSTWSAAICRSPLASRGPISPSRPRAPRPRMRSAWPCA
jgi:3-oxoacyl-(acyl-carrier-protein) synthase